MYPKTISLVAYTAKNIYIAHKLSSNQSMEISRIEGQNSNITEKSDKIKVVVMFDGGWKSVFTEAYEIMRQYHLQGSVSVIPSQVDKEGFLSYGELAELYLHQWDLLNHSFSHDEKHIDKSYELLSDFNKAREWMKNRFIGRNKDNVVVPFGEINPYLLKLLEAHGYSSLRTSDNVIILDKNKYHYFPVNILNLTNPIGVEDVENFLKESLVDSRNVILIFNKIGNKDNGLGMTYSKAGFEEVIKLLDKIGDNFHIVTYSELF